MKRFVCDCSVSAAWCLQDEHSDMAHRVLELLVEAEAIVPASWPAEMANVLLTAERHGRSRPGDAEAALEAIGRLPVRVDNGATPARLLSVARVSRLSAYDAAYLELALREGVPLATFDRQLTAAAGRASVELLT